MALIAAIVCTFMVLALGMALVSMSTYELKATREQGDTISLRNIAEAGVEQAFRKMNAEPTWRATNASDANFNDAPITATVDGATKTLGTFTVDPIVDQGGDYVQVTAHGYSPSATAANRLEKTVRVTAYKKWGTPFSAAAFGKNGIPLGNGQTDSYTSDVGGYYSQTPGTKGDVRTDSTDPSAITLGPQGISGGKVIFGPGTDLGDVTLDRNRIVDGDADETNDILAAPNTAVMPTVQIPSTAKELRTVSGFSSNTLSSGYLPEGEYWCNEINNSGNDKITMSGKVILYVKGPIAITGKGIVNTSAPANLQIYGTATCTSVKIAGNGNLSAAVYTPQADITLKGGGVYGDVFGALAGKTVSFDGNGTFLHYDEALQKVKGAVIGFRTKTWQED
jgi:hypothetical protein